MSVSDLMEGLAPSPLASALDEYLGYLAIERGSSPNTVQSYGRDLVRYLRYLEDAGIAEPSDVTRQDIEAHLEALVEVGLAPASVERAVSAIKGFHRFMVTEQICAEHPTADLPLPRKAKHLPDVISHEQAAALRTASEDFGVKRAILGISITELHRSSGANPASPYIRERAQAVGWAETAATIAGQLFDPATLKSSESLNCLFPWVGNHVDPNAGSILGNLRMRLTGMPATEAALVQDPAWPYVGQGYGAHSTTYDPNTGLGFYFTKEFIDGDDGALATDRVRTLHAICDFCAERGIELVTVGVPMPASNIEYYGERYFEQHELVTAALAEKGVPYYDFNLATPELFVAEPEYFADYAHLNVTGATAFGSALGAFLADPATRADEGLFYDADGYWASLEGISALLVETETVEGGTQVACTGLTAPKDTDRVEYRMLIAGADGSWEVARDWATDGNFLYERSERGTFDIRVEARMVGSNGDFERYRELTLYH